ncbi:MAG: hypothetical protein R3C61_11020 [Bacteroidia bacterium]
MLGIRSKRINIVNIQERRYFGETEIESMKVFLFPLIAFFLFAGCAEKNLQSNLPAPSAGKIERLENFPSQYIPARNVDIWLPEGYNPSQQYAVLYMHDGQMLYDAAPPGTNRNGEWTKPSAG